MVIDTVLILTALAFAWSMGAHYTGACMGMPYATGSIRLRPALISMAVLTLIGAVALSRRVLVHVGHGIVTGRVTAGAAIIVIGVAFLLTTLFTRLRIPTSTIQILIFALIGTATASGLGVAWRAVVDLAVLWVLAPFVAAAAGYGLTSIFDRFALFRRADRAARIGQVLVMAGGIASLSMGANDVSNATAVLLSIHLTGPVLAGAIGGVGLAAGVLTWGRPLLQRVAFDIVRMDRTMATAAQLVQAVVVLVAVSFGYFTSMNQALIGAMTGAGLARGQRTIDTGVLFGIVRGWVIGPGAAFILAYGAAWFSRTV